MLTSSKLIIFTVSLLSSNALAAKDKILYCDVCRGIVAEYRKAVSEMNKNDKVRITQGQGRLGSDGQLKTKSHLIPKYLSRQWLEDLFEEGPICNAMSNDYVKWFSGKDKKQWRIGRIMTYSGQMNTDVDLAHLQSGMGEAREVREKDPSDRTRSLRWYCENAVEDLEETIYKLFMKEEGNKDAPTKALCHDAAKWCGADEVTELFPDEMLAKSGKDEL